MGGFIETNLSFFLYHFCKIFFISYVKFHPGLIKKFNIICYLSVIYENKLKALT